MCATFTDDDIGKPVENATGEEVGVVATVKGDVAHVRPAADAVDSIKSSIGWEGIADDEHPLDGDSVREITDDAVRLEGELPTGGDQADDADIESAASSDEADERPRTEPAGGSAGIDEERSNSPAEERTDTIGERGTDSLDEDGTNRGLEADPTELARQDPEAELSPTEDAGSRTDAAVEPDAEPRRTDAAVDPGERPRRADTEGESSPVPERNPASSGPTTEGAGRADLEDGPERERRTDLETESDADSDPETGDGDEEE